MVHSYDIRGSVTRVANSKGTTTTEYSYSTYGNRISSEELDYSILGYCARDGVLTEANGLLYMRARYYSPDMMRFINEDIVTGDISNSNSLNRYSYVEGNPVTMVDPFGLCPQAKDAFDSIFDMEKIHGILDAVGFIPGLGDVCDGINALLYLSEGDMGNVALSALALLPLGDLLKGGKYTAKIVGKLDDIGGAVFKYLGKNCDNLLSTASKKVDDVLSFASKKCDNFFNFFRKHSDEMAEAVVRHGDDAVDSVLRGGTGSVPNSGQGFSLKGYNPQPGERTLNGYVKNNANPEISLHTNSAGFNSNNGNIGGDFKRFGTESHGGVSPHVHQPQRNVAPNGNVYGSVGSKTANGGVTSPSTKDVKQLYEYLNNGKYH